MTKEDLIKLIKWSPGKIYPTGGQQVNIVDRSVTLECETFDFKVTIGCHRSQLKNKELALSLLEIVVSETEKL